MDILLIIKCDFLILLALATSDVSCNQQNINFIFDQILVNDLKMILTLSSHLNEGHQLHGCAPAPEI